MCHRHRALTRLLYTFPETHVLTGGDSGIGFETALALASINASVIILSYDAKGSGAAAVANITALTHNPKARSHTPPTSVTHPSVSLGAELPS